MSKSTKKGRGRSIHPGVGGSSGSDKTVKKVKPSSSKDADSDRFSSYTARSTDVNDKANITEEQLQAYIKSSKKEFKTYRVAVLIKSGHKPESQMTTIEKMEVTNEGISKKELEQLKEKGGLDYDQLAYILDVARSTLIAKKSLDRFASGLSEKIMSLADIYSYGYEVFGDQEQFNQWIFEPVKALGGKAPYDILNNHYGRQEVRNLIGRIDYGVYS
jgi:putative toxin-antitoxin system antitoxin component (TIGR02293 family)